MSDHTQSFNSKSFYGAKCRKRRYEIKSLIEKQVEKQSKYSLPEEFKSRIGGPSSSWKIFYKQKEAFKFVQSTSEDLHVFCYEKEVVGEEKGQRLYLVTSYPVFWHYYRQLGCDKKHHYEIIPEGSVCKVYFDLEYMKEYNPESVGEEMVQIFIKYVCYWLKKKFDVSCDLTHVLNLDSSTEHKFSRHLIFQMKNAVFKNNIQLGYFVNEMIENLEDVVKHKEMLSDSGIDISIDDTHNNNIDMDDSLGNATPANSEDTHNNNIDSKQTNKMDDTLGNATPANSKATHNKKLDCEQRNKMDASFGNVTPANSDDIHDKKLGCKQQQNKMDDNLGNATPANSDDTHNNNTESKQTKKMDDSLGNATTVNSEDTHNNKLDCKQQTNKMDDSLGNATPVNSEDTHNKKLDSKQTNKMDASLGNVCPVNSEDIQGINKSEKVQTRNFKDATPANSEDLKDNEVSDVEGGSDDIQDEAENLQNEVFNGGSLEEKSENRFKESNEILEIFKIEDLQTLFIYNKNGDKIPFVDTGVYTKNRNFRLYLSSKLGKNNPLVLSDDNQFLVTTQEDLFLSSLISNVSYTDELRILKCCDDERSNEKSGVCFTGRNKNTEATIEGERSSPYPEIDQFIKSLINRDGKQGNVRHWTYFTSGELLIYDIAKYRFCENIHRHHRSNNIMYIVDIRRGVYYQKCHDPDCKKQDFKSQEHEIPKEYLPTYLLEQDDFMSNSDDDDVLLQAMENIEKNNTGHSDYINFTDSELSDNELLSITKEMEQSNDQVHKQ